MNNLTVPPSPKAYFSNLAREHAFEPVAISGHIPENLNGTLYRNGIGIFEKFGKRYKHVFEGDGAMSAVRLIDGKALASARMIESAGLLEEQQAKRNLYGSSATWSTRFYRGLKGQYKNTANTHVVPWQNRLFALMEGGKPTEVNPENLTTIGETDLDGVITSTFSAHPHYVATRQTLYNFGIKFGKQTALNIYALPDAGKPKMIASIDLDKSVMLHDFIVTDNYLIFFISPVQLKIWRLLLALGSFTDYLKWNPADGTEVIVVPIDHPDKFIRFHVEPFYVSHFAGAFEQGDELIVDYIRYNNTDLFTMLGNGSELNWTDKKNHAHGNLHRANINVVNKSFKSQSLWDGYCEFPRTSQWTSGRKHSFIWMQSEKYIENIFHAEVSKIDHKENVLNYPLEPGQLCSEPIPVIDSEQQEDKGSVLTLVFDCHTNASHLLILDAQTMAFQAKVQLSQVIPLTFHGSWVKS